MSPSANPAKPPRNRAATTWSCIGPPGPGPGLTPSAAEGDDNESPPSGSVAPAASFNLTSMLTPSLVWFFDGMPIAVITSSVDLDSAFLVSRLVGTDTPGIDTPSDCTVP